MQYVSVNGGLLVQDLDVETKTRRRRRYVRDEGKTRRGTACADLDFGWRIVKHVKSNAIVAVQGRPVRWASAPGR